MSLAGSLMRRERPPTLPLPHPGPPHPRAGARRPERRALALAGALRPRDAPPPPPPPPRGGPVLGVGHRRHYAGEDVGPCRCQAEVEAREARVVDVEEARERRVVRAAAGEDVGLGEELEGAYGAENRAEEDHGPEERDCD